MTPPDTGPEPTQTYSLLFKAAFFVLNSQIFPPMVRAACVHLDAVYSDSVVKAAAVDKRFLECVHFEAGQVDGDAALIRAATDPESAAALDKAIIAAVATATGKEVPA